MSGPPPTSLPSRRAFVRAPGRPPVPPPAPRRRPGGEGDARWAVRVLDNDWNTYQEVMRVVMEALGVDPEEAYAIAWTIDHAGSCVVAEAPRDEAEAIAAHIRTIGIEVVLEPTPPEA